MTQIWMGRRYRENRARMLAALERNKHRREAAMDEATKAVEAAGRAVGEEIAARQSAPAPGRILSKIKRPADPPKADALVESVVDAFPGARLVGIVDVSPEPAPQPEDRGRLAAGVILDPGPPMWYLRRPGQRDILLVEPIGDLSRYDPSELIRR